MGIKNNVCDVLRQNMKTRRELIGYKATDLKKSRIGFRQDDDICKLMGKFDDAINPFIGNDVNVEEGKNVEINDAYGYNEIVYKGDVDGGVCDRITLRQVNGENHKGAYSAAEVYTPLENGAKLCTSVCHNFRTETAPHHISGAKHEEFFSVSKSLIGQKPVLNVDGSIKTVPFTKNIYNCQYFVDKGILYTGTSNGESTHQSNVSPRDKAEITADIRLCMSQARKIWESIEKSHEYEIETMR